MISWIKNWIRSRRPIVIEESSVPVFLSHFAPIDIWAISFGPFVWCRGVMSPITRRHECIHFHQQLELAFVGQWILYLIFYLRGLLKGKSGEQAYRYNAFEVEAYTHEMEEDPDYLDTRELYSWVKYI